MISPLLQPEIQKFILEHAQDDEKNLVLQYRTILGISSSLIAEQIAGRRKAKAKLPLYYKSRNIIYPPGLNLEQSSSEETALFKAKTLNSMLGDDSIVADLTGGFGVDSLYLSRAVKKLLYVEPNATLLSIAQHNHQTLQANNIEHRQSTAAEFIQSLPGKIDCVFIDPSRRTQSNQKVFRLSDCEPDVPGMMDDIFAKTDCLLIKTSPLLDLQQGVRELQNVEKIWVVSIHNECKELLFFCRNGYAGGEPAIVAVNLQEGHRDFEFTAAAEKNSVSKFSSPLTYLYEPNASILKSGAFKLAGEKFSLLKLHPSTHLYTSNSLVEDFPGRIFKITDIVKPDPKMLKDIIPGLAANVITRNYPISAEALKKKTKITDGGDVYLIGFSGQQEKHLVVATRLK